MEASKHISEHLYEALTKLMPKSKDDAVAARLHALERENAALKAASFHASIPPTSAPPTPTTTPLRHAFQRGSLSSSSELPINLAEEEEPVPAADEGTTALQPTEALSESTRTVQLVTRDRQAKILQSNAPVGHQTTNVEAWIKKNALNKDSTKTFKDAVKAMQKATSELAPGDRPKWEDSCAEWGLTAKLAAKLNRDDAIKIVAMAWTLTL